MGSSKNNEYRSRKLTSSAELVKLVVLLKITALQTVRTPRHATLLNYTGAASVRHLEFDVER